MASPAPLTLAEVASLVEGSVRGDPDIQISGLASLHAARPGELTHLSSTAWRHLLATTQASAVILREDHAEDCPVAAIVVANPYLAYARISARFDPTTTPDWPGIHPTAVVDSSATVGTGVNIGPGASIAADAIIGDQVVIGAGSSVGTGAVVGDDACLFANVTVYPGVRLGQRVRVHSHTVLGADGFGFAHGADGRTIRIHQLGGLVIGDDCDIGAATTIDRGALDDTVIGVGVKIDNQVQIGHNCVIGDHTVICGCTGLVGSSRVGRHCVLAGGVGVGGDGPVNIADGTIVSGFSHVSESINEAGGSWSSGGLIERHGSWRRNALVFRDLDRLQKRVRTLERQLARGQHAVAERPGQAGTLRGNNGPGSGLEMDTVNEADEMEEMEERMNIAEIMEHLPHRYPFLLVDRVTAMTLGERIAGFKNVTINEPFFPGHFPGHPIMPGVLIVEAMAQLSGVLAFKSRGLKPADGTLYYLAGTDRARFKRPVVPGDRLEMASEILSDRLGTMKFGCEARVDGEVVCVAQLLCVQRAVA